MKFEAARIYFWSDVFVATAALVTRLKRLIGSSLLTSNHEGDGGENVTKKVSSPCFEFHRSYSISFNLSHVEESFEGVNSKALYLSSKTEKNIVIRVSTSSIKREIKKKLEEVVVLLINPIAFL